MNKKNNHSKLVYTNAEQLQSAVIDWLRLPLALAVVFIHSFGSPKNVDMVRLHTDPLCWQSIYDFVRIAGSNVITHCAVPTFFMISGFLFFYKVQEWNFSVYKVKLKKRFWSLLVPYLLWIMLFILHTEIFKLGGVLLHGKPLSGMWKYVTDNGGLNMLWDSTLWGGYYVDVLGRPAPMTSPVLVPLWFVRDLMVVVVFSPLIHWLIEKFSFISVLFFGVCYMCRIFIPIHGFSATCFFFFSLGAYFSIRGKNMVLILSQYRYPAYIIAFLSMVILVWFNGRKGDEMSPQPQCIHFMYYIYVVSAVISSVSIACKLLKSSRVGVNYWMAKATFFIFLSHAFVLGYVSRFTHHFIPTDCYPVLTIEYLLRPIITTIICLAIYWILERYVPRVLAVLTGGRLNNINIHS